MPVFCISLKYMFKNFTHINNESTFACVITQRRSPVMHFFQFTALFVWADYADQTNKFGVFSGRIHLVPSPFSSWVHHISQTCHLGLIQMQILLFYVTQRCTTGLLHLHQRFRHVDQKKSNMLRHGRFLGKRERQRNKHWTRKCSSIMFSTPFQISNYNICTGGMRWVV